MKKIRINSLLFKLALTFFIGSTVLAVCLMYINIWRSEEIFVDVFADSQTKIFNQIEESFYKFYIDVSEISASVAGSDKVKEFLAMDSDSDTASGLSTIYSMQKQVSQLKIREYDNLILLIAGMENQSYMYSKADQLSATLDEIRDMTCTKEAEKRSGQLICKYMERGFTNTTKNEPAVVYCRTIEENSSKEILGYVYLIIKETEMKSFYDYFTTGTSDIMVLNQDNEVISTNNEIHLDLSGENKERIDTITAAPKQNKIYKFVQTEKEGKVTYLVKRFSDINFVIVGTINPKKAFYERYNLALNVGITIGITVIIIGIMFFLVRHQTQSIYKLISVMRTQKDSNFEGYIQLDGTDEIRELSNTYNEMLSDLNHYMDKVIETEKEKRSAELRALQMQINPHYIYNTLAGIKWLTLQGNIEKSAEAIEAFIALLRNTISDEDEFITVKQEITNLQNYAFINQIRYGDKVKVDFYVTEECMDGLLPKMILQPFIENAFFHAFPKDKRGSIHVFMRCLDKRLIIEIADDGVGIEKDSLSGKKLPKSRNQEHFTGVGIRNVDERLKLLYGYEYGIHIESERNHGTTITIEIPFQTEDSTKN